MCCKIDKLYKKSVKSDFATDQTEKNPDFSKSNS